MCHLVSCSAQLPGFSSCMLFEYMFCTPSLYPRPCLGCCSARVPGWLVSCPARVPGWLFHVLRALPPARPPAFLSSFPALFVCFSFCVLVLGPLVLCACLLASIAIRLEHRICCRLPTAAAASCWPPLSVSLSFISRTKSNKFPSPYIIPSYFFSPKTSSFCHYYLLYIAVVAVLSSSSPWTTALLKFSSSIAHTLFISDTAHFLSSSVFFCPPEIDDFSSGDFLEKQNFMSSSTALNVLLLLPGRPSQRLLHYRYEEYGIAISC